MQIGTEDFIQLDLPAVSLGGEAKRHTSDQTREADPFKS